ncbi:hypothetical protein [Cytobacillus gottheilii]|uniref:hypothetical protein n=1 Tax=Cytobacillus gottheilii TaxID=859144 RepID=UPI0024945F35|nr:hypothetical protein [Cytobacillus gottheilii]
MHSAILQNGKLITAMEYIKELHGSQIFCLDPSCKSPVSFVPGTDSVAAHFKTSGKGGSIHTPNCGFYKSLSFQDSVTKVSEYQQVFKNKGLNEIVIRMNLNALDPDYQSKTVEREDNKKEDKEDPVIKVKNDNPTPQTLNTLKAVKKLFTSNEPDLLASILISIKGIKLPISYLIRNYTEAHDALWAENLNSNLPYFVHGTIEKVIRREKVWYINFSIVDGRYFSLVVFEPYFKHFTYKDEQLIGKEILSYGHLKKNTFTKSRESTEMQIKSNKYLAFL